MSITDIQSILGLKVDGIWGPKSQAAIVAATPAQKKLIQKGLGLKADGIWGPKSQTALNAATSAGAEFACKASSFADPADLVAFKKCKATGKTDIQCFAVGDNGIGQFGKITAQEVTPMVAVHKSIMRARWGSVAASAHRPVKVTVNGKTIDATVEDRISAPGRIDLNPACAKQLGLKPPFVVPCTWRWA
jgi:hypothetical protein